MKLFLDILKSSSFSRYLPGYMTQFMCASLYGILAFIISPVFFHEDSMLKGFAALGVFSLGRLVGGYFFGVIADLYGYTVAILSARLVSSLSTLLIGLLPVMEHAGLILCVLLLLQGFALGGDHGSNIAYIVKQKISDPVASMAILVAFSMLGSLASVTVGLIFDIGFLEADFWRFPFIAAGILGLMQYWVALSSDDEDGSARSSTGERSKRDGVFLFLKANHVSIILASLLALCSFVPLFVSSYFMNYVFYSILRIKPFYVLLNDCVAILCGIILILLSSRLISRIGYISTIMVSALSVLLVSIPTLAFLGLTVPSSFVLQYTLVFADATLVCSTSMYLSTLFKQPYDSRGVGLSLSSGAFLGGLVPSAILWLERYFELATCLILTLSCFSLIIFAVLTGGWWHRSMEA